MKKIILLLVLAAPALFAQTDGSQAAATNGPQVTAIDGYAARVDSTIITYGEVRESAAPYIQQLMQKYKGRELAERVQAAYLNVREELIEDALLKAETKSRGLALPEKAVNDEVNRIIRERFENNRTLLTRALTARRMTFEEWKKEVADQITVRVFYNQEVTRRAGVSSEAIRAEYERTREKYVIPFKVKYSFILINKGKTAEDLAVKRNQAENTLQKLLNGAAFDTVAKDISEGDPAVTAWRSPEDVREELRPALRDTPAGQISGLIETPGEFYIIKIVQRREAGCTPFEEVKGAIEKKLLNDEKERLHNALIDAIKVNHFIERY
ncbi:MAG: peptidyl-prolyl cis-trans isomerase [Pontiellaceae bacterium]|jgi:parvulin-like peptidyl-prolyl isomerase|nr:peptidyl-prolyl cis-trans isomerase [Pontiellaceae bacterium]